MGRGTMLVTMVGSVGTVCGLLAYLLMANGRWSSISLRYASVNVVAGAASTMSTFCYHAWPSVISNGAWTAIAVGSVVKLLAERRTTVATREPGIEYVAAA